MKFKTVGIVTIDGEREERTAMIMPPETEGIGWALTLAVSIFNNLTDDGTEHHGVWCYPESEDHEQGPA